MRLEKTLLLFSALVTSVSAVRQNNPQKAKKKTTKSPSWAPSSRPSQVASPVPVPALPPAAAPAPSSSPMTASPPSFIDRLISDPLDPDYFICRTEQHDESEAEGQDSNGISEAEKDFVALHFNVEVHFVYKVWIEDANVFDVIGGVEMFVLEKMAEWLLKCDDNNDHSFLLRRQRRLAFGVDGVSTSPLDHITSTCDDGCYTVKGFVRIRTTGETSVSSLSCTVSDIIEYEMGSAHLPNAIDGLRAIQFDSVPFTCGDNEASDENDEAYKHENLGGNGSAVWKEIVIEFWPVWLVGVSFFTLLLALFTYYRSKTTDHTSLEERSTGTSTTIDSSPIKDDESDYKDSEINSPIENAQSMDDEFDDTSVDLENITDIIKFKERQHSRWLKVHLYSNNSKKPKRPSKKVMGSPFYQTSAFAASPGMTPIEEDDDSSQSSIGHHTSALIAPRSLFVPQVKEVRHGDSYAEVVC